MTKMQWIDVWIFTPTRHVTSKSDQKGAAPVKATIRSAGRMMLMLRRRGAPPALFTWAVLILQYFRFSQAWIASKGAVSSVSGDTDCRRQRSCTFASSIDFSDGIERMTDCCHEAYVTAFSRRRLLQSIVATATGAVTTPSLASAASGLATAPSVVSSLATCDATVSVWQRENRLVYILGTAHISETSANLAGQLVRDVHPDAVFVELDLKRVGGLANTKPELNEPGGDGGTVPASMILIPAISTTAATLGSETTASSTALVPSGAELATSMPTSRRATSGFGLDIGAAAVGNAIRGMYKNLNQAGFNPGDEFVEAVREGRRIGADIVLGDRDVQVTLRRLVQALQVTDMNALMDPNSELEQSMRELLPGGGEIPTDSASYKEEVSAFVEAIKNRDRVRSIMSELKKVAPALVQVMLTERDAYMAAGLDSLNEYVVIVAVMGMAHQDGVELNLTSAGWKQLKPRCRNGKPV
jgi:TraB/PrgY/gumN family